MAKQDNSTAQEKYLEFQLIQQQMEQLTKYAEELEAKQMEFASTKESLIELGKSPPGSELFAPVAQGIFTKAALIGQTELLVNVGADVAVTKPMPDVIRLIDQQITEVASIKININQNIEKLAERLNSLAEALQQLS